MNLTTVAVSILANLITGAPMANGSAHFELTGPDKDGAVVVPTSTDVTLDANGSGTVNLWPNARGVNGTQYRVMLYDASSNLQFAGVATIPASACNLHDVLTLVPPAKVSDAQAASNTAQAAALQASGSASSAAASAAAAQSDRQLADADLAAATAAAAGVQSLFNRMYLGGY